MTRAYDEACLAISLRFDLAEFWRRQRQRKQPPLARAFSLHRLWPR